MTMGASVRRTVLSVVTFIVATKTLGIWGSWWFEKEGRKDLGRGRNNLTSSVGLQGGDAAKESIFLRESHFGDKSGGQRDWSRGDS